MHVDFARARLHAYQVAGYDPNAADHRQTARELGLPWDMCGDFAASGKSSGNQKQRGDGRFANSGGFQKRVGLIFTASDKDWFFNLANPVGVDYAHACTGPYRVHIEGCGYDRTHIGSAHMATRILVALSILLTSMEAFGLKGEGWVYIEGCGYDRT